MLPTHMLTRISQPVRTVMVRIPMFRNPRTNRVALTTQGTEYQGTEYRQPTTRIPTTTVLQREPLPMHRSQAPPIRSQTPESAQELGNAIRRPQVPRITGRIALKLNFEPGQELTFDPLGVDRASCEFGLLQYSLVEAGGCLDPSNAKLTEASQHAFDGLFTRWFVYNDFSDHRIIMGWHAVASMRM